VNYLIACERAQVHFLPPPTLPERKINDVYAEEKELQFLASARIAIHEMISKRKIPMRTQTKLSLGSLFRRCACVYVCTCASESDGDRDIGVLDVRV
jgi:hypothetical protein